MARAGIIVNSFYFRNVKALLENLVPRVINEDSGIFLLVISLLVVPTPKSSHGISNEKIPLSSKIPS